MKAFATVTQKKDGIMQPGGKAKIAAAIAEIPDGTEFLVGIVPAGSLPAAMNIDAPDVIVKGINEVLALAQHNVDHTNPSAVMDLLNELSGWLAYAGQLQAQAKYWLLVAELDALNNVPEHLTSPTERKKWCNAKAAEYAALYEQAERLTAAVTHRCDHLRTFISYHKQEMTLAAFPPSQK